MRLQELLAIGQKLHVKWHGRTYPSLLLDIDDSYLYVGVIQSLGVQVHLAPGAEIEVAFGIEDKGYFRFSSVVEEEVVTPAPALKLAWPTHLVRVQQRMHYRLSVQLPFVWRLVNNRSLHSSFISNLSHTVNISGGGLQFVSEERLSSGDRLELDLLLNPQPQIGLLAEVLRVADNFDGTYQVAVKFVDLSRMHEEAIVRYIFQEQVRRRRLELQ